MWWCCDGRDVCCVVLCCVVWLWVPKTNNFAAANHQSHCTALYIIHNTSYMYLTVRTEITALSSDCVPHAYIYIVGRHGEYMGYRTIVIQIEKCSQHYYFWVCSIIIIEWIVLSTLIVSFRRTPIIRFHVETLFSSSISHSLSYTHYFCQFLGF